jgi:hypothetical protein
VTRLAIVVGALVTLLIACEGGGGGGGCSGDTLEGEPACSESQYEDEIVTEGDDADAEDLAELAARP